MLTHKDLQSKTANATDRCVKTKKVCWYDESDVKVSNIIPTPELNQNRMYKKYSAEDEAKVVQAVKL